MPSSSLLAEILLQKYEYHMPFYRQIKQFAHLGMTGLKEATIVGWFKRTMELLRPLYDVLVREIFSSGYIQSDETNVPVINGEKHQADKEYLWMARAVMERLSAFFYNDGLRGEVIKEKTDQYKVRGYVQCDGYPAYTSAYGSDSVIVLVLCLVHIRRYFKYALDENRKDASWFLARNREIYLIESECDKAGIGYDDARKAVRQSKTSPLMHEMKAWLKANAVKYSSRTLIGKAIGYAYTRWDAMMRILDDGMLLPDNNLAENEPRPITPGRKNYLFCGNHEAAENMCVVISLLSTCRNHDINPRMYLNSVIESMPYFMGAPHEELVRPSTIYDIGYNLSWL